jgi:hypothetical protein
MANRQGEVDLRFAQVSAPPVNTLAWFGEGPCCLSFEKVFHFPTELPNQTDVGYLFGYLCFLFVLS